MEKLTFICDIMHKDDIVGKLDIRDGELRSYRTFGDDFRVCLCPEGTPLPGILDFLSQRVLPEVRCTPKMLQVLGIKEYNVYDILRITHGTDTDDFTWFRFPGETLTWKDVNPR